MGTYLNPGNASFHQIRNSEYVDKTGLIDFINNRIDTLYKLICVSRPRRFGKTLAAKMLCAYYDKSCDSRKLFEGLKISEQKSFDTHLNQYNVIYLDITRFISRSVHINNLISDIQNCVIAELRIEYPNCISKQETFLPDALANITKITGNRFFIIIDEWDALFREAKENTSLQKNYLQLLRGLFKGGPSSDQTIVGAYMTGILPIKKYGTESALTDFREYSMVNPLQLSEYVGFTEKEVQQLCETYQLDFNEMEQWYDGYSFSRVQHVYSPNSVMSAIYNEEIGNYWTKTETYESLKDYISINMDGLKDSIIAMLGGERIKIDPLSFQNDITTLKNKDDVLTLLVHLGYLAYNEKNRQVYIPNLEVSDSFKLAVQDTRWDTISTALKESDTLLHATIHGDCRTVANVLDYIHETSCSILQYNNENSLSCALTIAYYTARNDYEIFRELPTGKGFADLAFLPKKNCNKPAMIIELKYDQSADTAIRQIKEKRYGGVLKNYAGKLVLVGINYSKASKKHDCFIEIL